MTPDRPDETPDDDAEHGILDDSGTLDTASISILGGHIAQVSVSLPTPDDGDDRDDDVVEDELPVEDIVIEPPAAAEPTAELARPGATAAIDEVATGDIILEPHPSDAEFDHGDVHDADVVDDHAPHDGAGDADGAGTDTAEPDARTGDAAVEDSFVADAVVEDSFVADAAEEDALVADAVPRNARAEEAPANDAPRNDDAAAEHSAVDAAPGNARGEDARATDAPRNSDVADEHGAADAAAENARAEAERMNDVSRNDDVADELGAADPAAGNARAEAARTNDVPLNGLADARDAEDASAVQASVSDDADVPAEAATGLPDTAPAPARTPEPVTRAPWTSAATAVSDDKARPAGGEAGQQAGSAAVARPVASTSAPQQAAVTPTPATRAERAATGVIGTVPLTRREVNQADEAARLDRAHAVERVRVPAPAITMSSKRLGELDDTRESPDLLTADRLLDPKQIAKPEPEGLWQQLVYSLSRHRINLGDGRRARARKDLDRRIAAPLSGVARFVPVLSRKGGVGKTTVTALLGLALADARDDRVIAVDANPDRGTLADRVGGANGRTVRDLVRARADVSGYSDVSSIVARDATRLDVLASDADPRVSEAFSDDDYRDVAEVAARFYSIILTDTGTGIVHSVMEATLAQSDSLVVVAGLSVDEARLASETLTWLETNGYAARVREAIVVLNNARPGAPLVRESELEAHFRTRVRAVIRMPYDPLIAAGSAITFRDLQPSTRQAARELAAAVVEGLRTPVAAA